MFADELDRPGWNRSVRIDADPTRQPLPRPALRIRYVAIGPVAVFGPANFPLAFTVAGGDTASALAAGCPVVVKAHSSHPGTSELVGHAIVAAVRECGLPPGTFSLLFGSGKAVGTALVEHPAIRAVGFTGSETVGRGLFDLASRRPVPIPVFAEMSSVNPVLLLSGALTDQADAIAAGFCQSVTLGVGQFCTNPGIVLLPDDPAGHAFAQKVVAGLASHPEAPMLNRTTADGYHKRIMEVAAVAGVQTLLPPQPAGGPARCHARPALFAAPADLFCSTPTLQHEIFGPASILIWCSGHGDMLQVLRRLGGQLTCSIHANDTDLANAPSLLHTLEQMAGRIVFNGFPTGVEVSEAMVHGGPYPATTDGRFTSVGTRAIDRFLRPVCHQNAPASLS
jgi:NADP-dependent aldehyde dehydrogenase